jgi:hypothetical protein
VVPRVSDRPEAPIAARVAPHAPIVSPEPEPEPVTVHESTPTPTPTSVRAEPELVLSPTSAPEPSAVFPRWCSECDTVAEPDDLYCAECGHRLADDTRVIEPITARAVADVPIVPLLESTVEPEPLPAAVPLDSEATRILSRQAPLPTFVLQFSTGESYTVVGSGLAGRNPRPEPGEVVDHLVMIVDPGRSVSKTHLEFGQTDGVFWVIDRFSGNGTVIQGEAGERRACAPGRRYPIARGTRIDLGEQFLIVS